MKYPVDVTAENALIGGILLDPSKFRDVSVVVRPEMFSSVLAKHLFIAMLELQKEGKPVDDWVCLANKLKNNGGLEQHGGLEKVMSLMDIPDSVNTHHYAEIVRRYHWYRLLIDKSADIQSHASRDSKDLLSILRSATDMFKEFSAASNIISLSLKNVIRNAAERISSKADIIPWGLQRIDKDVGGLIKREPIVVAGRTSNLKTTFVTSPVQFWIENGQRVQIFSLEVAADQYLKKLICSKGQMDSRAVNTHALNAKQIEQYVEMCTRIYNEYEDKLCILDFTDSIKSLDALERAARAFKPDIMIVDYIGLLPTSKQYKRIEVEEHMIFLKELAIDLNCASVIVAQINRAPMKKIEGPLFPRPEDLKESGGIEENACQVYLLYYHYTITGDEKDKYKLRVNLAKNKYGPLGTWNMFHDPIHCEIKDLGIDKFDQSGKELPLRRVSSV